MTTRNTNLRNQQEEQLDKQRLRLAQKIAIAAAELELKKLEIETEKARMGCDIHMFTERKQGSEWLCCDIFYPNEKDNYSGWEQSEFKLHHVYDGRWYPIFGLFAAGVRFEFENKGLPVQGLPEDLSELVQNEADSWGIDGHTHNYVTMRDYRLFTSKLMLDPSIPQDVLKEWVSIFEDFEAHFKRVKQAFHIWSDDDPRKLDENYRLVYWFDN